MCSIKIRLPNLSLENMSERMGAARVFFRVKNRFRMYEKPIIAAEIELKLLKVNFAAKDYTNL